MTATVPVRKMDSSDTISYRLLNTDGTESESGTTDLSTAEYAETRFTDKRYNLYRVAINKRLPDNLRWLSRNHPFVFEEVLCLLEDMDSKCSKSMTHILNHPLTPDRKITESYILTYYRHVLELSHLLFALVDGGFHGADGTEAWSLFVSTRTACGYTVEHQQFKSMMLAVWIMQDTHHPIRTPLWAKDNEANLALIASRFQEVYDTRHELRSRPTIDCSTVEELLQQIRPLRAGAL